jgi:hypothetical protein
MLIWVLRDRYLACGNMFCGSIFRPAGRKIDPQKIRNLCADLYREQCFHARKFDRDALDMLAHIDRCIRAKSVL